VVDNNKVTQNGQHLFQATDTPTATNGTPDIPEDIVEDIDIVMARESQAIEETLFVKGISSKSTIPSSVWKAVNQTIWMRRNSLARTVVTSNLDSTLVYVHKFVAERYFSPRGVAHGDSASRSFSA
jgi:hypothetical protein